MSVTSVLDIRDLRFRRPGRGWQLSLSSLQLQKGETVFLHGPSGSGKSTLLNLVAGTLAPQDGRLQVCGSDMAALSGAARDRLRANHLGIIFQQFNLLPFLGMADNVLLPCRFSARREQAATQRFGSPGKAATALLERLGLGDPALQSAPVAELSVGQQQRVAVARALIGAPDLVLADEPTSALDSDARDGFLKLLFAECEAAQSALLFVSHDLAMAPRFSQQASLSALASGATA
jgi:putative ABC transport system ATP-binding protein